MKPKKEKEEPLSPAKILSANPHTTVDALVTSLSPQRKNSQYFNGEFTDGDGIIRLVRLVGFDSDQREKHEYFFKQG